MSGEWHTFCLERPTLVAWGEHSHARTARWLVFDRRTRAPLGPVYVEHQCGRLDMRMSVAPRKLGWLDGRVSAGTVDEAVVRLMCESTVWGVRDR